MPTVTFITADGAQEEVHAEVNTSLMQAAVDNGIDAILAECGGACSCATCHCYIDEAWQSKTGTPDDMEESMLDCVVDREAGSRLSCQIQVTEDMEGLVVRLPASQY